jgi:hypothetical protein
MVNNPPNLDRSRVCAVIQHTHKEEHSGRRKTVVEHLQNRALTRSPRWAFQPQAAAATRGQQNHMVNEE